MGDDPLEKLHSQVTYSGALLAALEIAGQNQVPYRHFLAIMGLAERNKKHIRAELVRAIATRAHLDRKELEMPELQIDKPKIIIPPAINVGEDDIQLKFYQIGDGIAYQLDAKEGEDGMEWNLFRFIPGKGIHFFTGVQISSPDFPTDGDGRLRLIDRKNQPLEQVPASMVKGAKEEKTTGGSAIKWAGWNWALVESGGQLLLRGGKGEANWNIIALSEKGFMLPSSITDDCPIKLDDDGAIHHRE